MGFADSVMTKLFVNRRLHDVDAKLQTVMNRKMAVAHRGTQVTSELFTAPTDQYAIELMQLHEIENELTAKQKQLETQREALKLELEAMTKMASDHAKTDFKFG